MLNISQQAGIGNVGGVTSPTREYGSVLNETSPGAKDGTKTAAQLVNDLYYALYAVVNNYGGTISNASEDTDLTSGTQDLLDALKAGMKSTDNPYANYAIFEESLASGVDGTTLTANTPTKRVLTQVQNNIAGSSLASSVLTLPAGTYRVHGWSTAHTTADAPMYTVTTVAEGDSTAFADTLVSGRSVAARTDGRITNNCSEFEGVFTFATSSTITLRTTSNYTGGGLATSFDASILEKYALLVVQKLD
jgi:hypothetical protein